MTIRTTRSEVARLDNTEFLNLGLPDENETFDIDVFSDNFEKIDSALQELAEKVGVTSE
mgnify:CR=1 FL=1